MCMCVHLYVTVFIKWPVSLDSTAPPASTFGSNVQSEGHGWSQGMDKEEHYLIASDNPLGTDGYLCKVEPFLITLLSTCLWLTLLVLGPPEHKNQTE